MKRSLKVDSVTAKCRKVRAKLVKQFGGLDGWFDELQRLDRKRLAAEAAKKKAKRASAAASKKSKSR